MSSVNYFGSTDKQLLGVYQPPRAAPQDHGVLLCYPAPQEYMRTHWAFRSLADLLTREGLHVLRFDYYATGDSAGASAAGTLQQWVDDIGTAATELRDVAGIKRLSAVGLRLGASLAALACARSVPLRDLVLWEPVIDGASYLQELYAIEATKYTHLLYPPKPTRAGHREELLGYPFPEALQNEVRNLDLRRVMVSEAQRVAIMVEHTRPEHVALCERWQDKTPILREVHEDAVSAQTSALLSHKMLRSIVDVIMRRDTA